jgi:alpha-glucan, water dikinase
MLAEFRSLAGAEETAFERVFEVGERRLAAAVIETQENFRLALLSDLPGELVLHWGIALRSPHEWLLPPNSIRGRGTSIWQNQAAQTPFVSRNGYNALSLEFPKSEAPLGIQFVLKQKENGERWLKHRGGNFFLPVQRILPEVTPVCAVQFAALADEIIRAESHNSWTLMHRFNLCHDLLDRARNDPDSLALLYVWLRFSAIRQLTWQRNYNTKPRELAHAQDRLTWKLSAVYHSEPRVQPLVRLALATVGRGGEGQRIRDEILNIMHRHHLKEVSGHFLEEWHQKLHNNTTPDDVVICEAYLEFLRSNGDAGRFYQTLEAGGVTRQRLEGFERPIRTSPQFVPYLKEGLLHDFSHFLTILKASHSGTDFETALNAARNQLDGGLRGLMDYLWQHRNDSGVALAHFVGQLTEARRRLARLLVKSDGLRELIYLDLALEQLLRGLVERNIHVTLSGEQLSDLITCVLENVTLSHEDPELTVCTRHWERLQSLARFSAEWALHAKSVVDRMSRSLSAWIDLLYQLLQPKAEYLGNGFHAEAWTIKLFSEEVVRGSSLGFVLSILLRHLDPMLRQAARIGAWQIVSRGQGRGRVEVVHSLRSIQRSHFETPTVLIADEVMGDEDIPQNITAVIAPDVTDIVSHVAVRARNANLLFASCHDPALFEGLKARRGQFLRLEVSPAGDLVFEEDAAAPAAAAPQIRNAQLSLTPRNFTTYAVPQSEFSERTVGGKSLHLAQLKAQLPDWIRQPASVALPFGVFEKVLSLDANQNVAVRCRELLQQAQSGKSEALATLRDSVLTLTAPADLQESLRETMKSSDLPWPEDWDKAWRRIKQVWASKWNDRAFLSRARMQIPHERLCMAVLIQQVVPADYAFVLHTRNPSTGNAQELFGEVVLGLGETLVGNHPGRALGFVWDKAAGSAALLSYPSKNTALYGSGLIFRSDSNGEDLEGYAGAGLYDSVLLDEPRQVVADYTQEPLVWDDKFRFKLLAALARIGQELERICGSPQDIEGVISQGQYFVVQTRPQVGLGSDNSPSP